MTFAEKLYTEVLNAVYGDLMRFLKISMTLYGYNEDINEFN